MAEEVIRLKLVIDGKEAIAELQLTDAEIKKLSKAFADAEQNGKKMASELVDNLTAARNSIQGLREVYGIFAQIFSKPIELTIDDEQARVAFQTFLGSAEKADALIRELKKTAAETPLQLKDLRDNAMMLMQFGVAAEEIIPTLIMLGNIAGGNAQKLNQLALVFGQIRSAGRLTGQDLLQLINAGFNPLQVISEKTGKTMMQLKKEMEDGAISFDMVKQAFIEVTSEGGKFYNLMEQQSKTLGGRISTLQDNFSQLMINIGGSTGSVLSPFIQHLIDLSNTINKLPTPISGAIGSFSLLTAALVTLRVTGIGKTISELFKLGPSLQSTGLYAAAAIPPVTGLASAFRAASISVKSFFASLGPIGWAMLGLSAFLEIANAMDLFSSKSDEAATSINGLNEKFKDLKDSEIKTMMDETNKLLEQNRQQINKLRDDYDKLSNTDVKSNEQAQRILDAMSLKRQEINNRLETQSKLQSLLNELTTEYNRRNEQTIAILNTQINQLRQRLEVSGLSGYSKDIAMLKQKYEEDKNTLKKSLETKVITEKEFNDLSNKLDKEYQTERSKIWKDYNEKSRNDKLNAATKELEIEKNYQLKNLELNGATKEELLQKEIEYLQKKQELLKSYGKSYTEVSYEIELKKLELSKTTLEDSFNKESKTLENEFKIKSKTLELTNASNEEILKAEIEYLNQKFELYEKYNKDITDIEIELKLKQMELSSIGKMDKETKEKYENDLAQLDDYYAEQYRLLEDWKNKELERYKNDEEAKALIHQLYEKRKSQITQEENQARLQSTLMALNIISSAFAKHTLLSKMASAAMATINTYEAATKALTAGPILGPILAAIITAAGLANVANILAVETPSATAYEKGGFAIVGEKGPEIIAPVIDYAQGQAMLVNAVLSRLSNYQENAFVDKLLTKLDNWQSKLEFRIRRGDLYTAWVKEQEFINRNT
jgi:tape measure domain-containing protein